MRVIAKSADATYSAGRSPFKCARSGVRRRRLHRAQGQPGRAGCVLVGYYDGARFVYAGKVGTGFTDKVLHQLRRQLDALASEEMPFAKTPPKDRDALVAARARRTDRLHRMDT